MKIVLRYFKFIVICLLCQLSISVRSQDPEVDVKFGRQFNTFHHLRSVIGQIGTKVYIDTYEYEGTLRADIENLADKIRFVVIDTENMGNSAERVEKLPEFNSSFIKFPEYNGKHLDYRGAVTCDDRVLLLFKQKHFADKMQRFFVLPLDADLRVAGDLKLIFEKPAQDKMDVFSCRIEVNEFKKQFSATVVEKEEDGKKNVIRTVFSANLDQISENNFTCELGALDVLLDYHVSESGELHLIIKHDLIFANVESMGKAKAKAEAKKRGGGETFRYLRLDNNSNIITDFELGDASHPVSGANFYKADHNPSKMSTQDGQIFILGEYSKPGMGTVLEGIFSQFIDLKSTKISETVYQDLDKELYSDIVNPGSLSGSAFSRMKHFRPCLQDDGSYVCFAEMAKESVENSKMQPGTNDYIYEYDHVMVYSMTVNGGLKWSEVIHKLQHTKNDNAICSSLVTLNTDEGIRVVYNDNVENFNALPDQKIKKMNNYNKGKAATVVLKIGKEGKITPAIMNTDFNKRLIVNFNSNINLNNGNERSLFFLGNVGILELKLMPIVVSFEN